MLGRKRKTLSSIIKLPHGAVFLLFTEVLEGEKCSLF